MTLRRNVLPPSSDPKSKPSKYDVGSRMQGMYCAGCVRNRIILWHGDIEQKGQ
jgi:hypothetical protein